MENLKILKEINEDFLQDKGYEILCPEAFRLLRKEAIKWIKASKGLPAWIKLVNYDNMKEANIAHEAIENWIKYFFSIDSKELEKYCSKCFREERNCIFKKEEK